MWLWIHSGLFLVFSLSFLSRRKKQKLIDGILEEFLVKFHSTNTFPQKKSISKLEVELHICGVGPVSGLSRNSLVFLDPF